MRSIYHQPIGESRPRRGDLLQSNPGDRRERTWMILGTHTLPNRFCPELGGIGAQRTRIWAARWWELEPEMRMSLWGSAERRLGGQQVYTFVRFPPKRKQTF